MEPTATMPEAKSGFFDSDAARKYDERNSKLSPIADCLHFLTGLVLQELPARARILCVGVGTGTEILSLARSFPEWRFVALDPSLDMLSVCRERIEKAGLRDRCELVHGYVQDLPTAEPYDAALSLLVAHFIGRDGRIGFFRTIASHLKAGGLLVNAEISFDLDSPGYPGMLKGWEKVQSMMGATPESLAKLPSLLREVLTVIPPEETEELLRRSDIENPIRFFQAMMICGWFGTKR